MSDGVNAYSVESREATVADLPAIIELARLGLDEQREARGGSIWSVRETRAAPFELTLREAMTDPDHAVFVATVDGVVLGYASVRGEHLRSGDALGVIDDIHVDPEAREVGLGEVLMALIVPWCEARNCVGIDGLALPGNRLTKNFFESNGFKARLITVHRSLRG
jgi:GNAT superfamily N-acetyltransferase